MNEEFLVGLGIAPEVATSILEKHTESVTSVQTDADTYKSQLDQFEQEKVSEIESIHKGYALNSVLSNFKFTSKFAEQGIRQELENAGLPFKDGSFEGVDDFLKNIRESHPDAFVPEVVEEEPPADKQKQKTYSAPSQSKKKPTELTPEEYIQQKYPQISGLNKYIVRQQK